MVNKDLAVRLVKYTIIYFIYSQTESKIKRDLKRTREARLNDDFRSGVI